MLPRSCFSDDPLLTHFARQEDLAQGVIDFMRAGMAEILTFKVDLCPSELFGQSLGEGERRFSPRELVEVPLKLSPEFPVSTHLGISLFQIHQCRHERLGNVTSAKNSVMPSGIRNLWQL